MGDLTLALALGFILLALSLAVNISAWLLRDWGGEKLWLNMRNDTGLLSHGISRKQFCL